MYTKRVFVIADFKDDSPKSIRVERRRWPKGLIRLGHDVQRFSYRDIVQQCSPLPGNKFTNRFFGIPRANEILLEQLQKYHPDIVLIMSLKDFDSEMVKKMKESAKGAVFVGRDCDPFPEVYAQKLSTAKEMDILTATNAGKFLQTYKDLGIPLCAFIPCPCDPDIQQHYDVNSQWQSDIIFTGTEEHRRLERDTERYNLLTRLSQMSNVKLYGCFGRPTVDGIETFYAISGAKIAMSINPVNNIRLYHSDRLINCLSCGTFTLSKRVPDTELLFKDGVHLRYFDTADEFFELADWYLKHDEEREKIAHAGMEHAHKEFNCTKMAGYLMDLVETGKYNTPWATII